MNITELNQRIDEVCESFHGQLPDLFQMVGIVVAGRLFGWRVVRLVVSVRIWRLVTATFGDPKIWMPERGRLAYKSLGLKLVDEIGDYWGFIRGSFSRDISDRERKSCV